MKRRAVAGPEPNETFAPIFVTSRLFDQVEDMSKVLEQINESGNEAE